MSNIIKHELRLMSNSGETIESLLRKDGIVSKRTVYRCHNRQGDVEGREIPSAVDMGLCDRETAYSGVDPEYMTMHDSACSKQYSDYEERVERNLREGWEIDPNGEDGDFRRLWDARVYESLALQPVAFMNGAMVWVAHYACNDKPAIAVSKRYPDMPFEYTETGECGDTYCHVMLKGGKEVENMNHPEP